MQLNLLRDDIEGMLINLKDYPRRFSLCGLPVVKVGVNFGIEERNITGWVVRS